MPAELRTCTTVDGRTIALPRARFVVRPSVYARIIHAAARRLGQHLARRGMVYQPDLVALRRGLSSCSLIS